MKQIFFLIIGLSIISAQGQGLHKNTFRLIQDGEDVPYSGSLHGYGIVDLLVKDSILWAATGYALNKSADGGEQWQAFTKDNHQGKGGITAFNYMDDQTLWIATAFDTTISGEDLTAGGGLSYTKDGGQSWVHIPQPVDPRDVTDYSPTTTKVQNIAYDIAFIDSTIWIASYGGGLRRSDDMGETWQVVTTDGRPFSSGDYVNHRAFSLLNENDNLWVGTAEGISKTSDNGKTWERFTASNQEFPISGNFVVALAYQQETHTVWAATIEALDTSEVRAVSKTSNGGETWDVMLEGNFPHNFGFDGKRVYVAADEGLFVSDDEGETWYTFGPIRSYDQAEELFFEEYYSVASQKFNGRNKLWLGTSRGLALTENNGNTWEIVPAFVSTKTQKKDKVYAYPSPFTPTEDGFCRFQVIPDEHKQIDIKIYDFSMDLVRKISIDQLKPKWDGKNDNGNNVASGVYFFRAEVDGDVNWGKIVVVN